MAGDNQILYAKSAAKRKLISHIYNQIFIPLAVLVVISSLLHPGVHGSPTTVDSDSEDDQRSFGVIIDAGSSGSRVRVYAWIPENQSGKLPDFVQIYSHRVTPGISEFANNIAGLTDYITPLIKEAKDNVPEKKHGESPIFLMATAGMRLLLEDHANDVQEKLEQIFKDKSLNPFAYYSQNTRILSGEEEGAFAWIAVNYLTGFFEPGSKVQNAGILELGGASTQIAFIPDGSILADKFPMRIGGRSYALYVHSYLYYGANYVKKRITEKLFKNNTESFKVKNPCLLRDDGFMDTINGMDVVFEGTGNPEECLKLMTFIYKADDDLCYPKPCSIGTVYQPTISPSHVFYAVGNFFHPPNNFNVADNFSPRIMREAALEMCNATLDEALRRSPNSKAKFISNECMLGLYMSELFTKGYGFSHNSQQIKVQHKINDKTPDWTLGAIIYETERMKCVRGDAVSSFILSHTTSFIIALLALEYLTL